MRETISIDKNFLTGEVKESVKIKPNSEVQGVVTIKLMNEDGEIEREVKTENVVMDWIKNDAYSHMYGGNFMKTESTAFYNRDYTSHILLTDCEEEESSRKPYLDFNIIGYCGKHVKYSGPDSLKGTYNGVESKDYIDEEGNYICHLVYDFPTHACNGEIKSVMWATNENAKLEYFTKSNTSVNPESLYLPKNTNVYYDPNKKTYLGLTNRDNNVVITTVDEEWFTVGALNTDGNPNLCSTFSFRNIDGQILILGTYVSKEDTGNGWVHFWDLDGNYLPDMDILLPGVCLKKVTGGFLNSNSSVGSYRLMYADGYVYGSYRYGSSWQSGGVSSYNVETEIGIFTESSDSTRNYPESYIRYVNDDVFAVSTLYMNGTYGRDAQERANSMSFGNCSFPILGLTSESVRFSWGGRDYYNANTHFKLTNLGKTVTAHTKLPTPIIKTNTNTMKVQYDFIYKPSELLDFVDKPTE